MSEPVALTESDQSPSICLPATAVAPALIHQQLTKLLNSRLFAKSPRLSRFLRFCVEQALAGQKERLKEYVIGVEVFGRTEAFDPRLDSIVRVEARRLRAKLDRYYEEAGASDAVVISFQRGDYCPRFSLAYQGEEGSAEGSCVAATPARLLIVESEREAAQDLEKRLNRLQYEVVGTVDSGAAAVEQIAQLHPDLVLMDVVLTGELGGIEAGQTIRQRFGVPVVYLTAHSSSRVLERIKQANPAGFLLKPYHTRELHALIQLALHRHAQERESAHWQTPESVQPRREQWRLAMEMGHLTPWEWRITDASRPWPESVSNEPGSPSLSPAELLDRIWPADREIVQAAMTRSIQEGAPLTIRCRLRQSSGEPLPVTIRGTVRHSATGHPEWIGGVLQENRSEQPARWSDEVASTLTLLEKVRTRIAGDTELAGEVDRQAAALRNCLSAVR